MLASIQHKKLWLVVCLLVPTAFSFAADTKGIDGDLIKNLRSGYRMNTQSRAMYNAITNTDIKTLTLNRDLLKNHNDFYTHKVDEKHISNQRASGRCWMFATLNVLQPEVIKNNNLESFQFSHIYLTFWDKLEKANTFYEYILELRQKDLMDRKLSMVLKNPIPDGGYWENARNLIEKYGAVPNDVMPETNSSNNTKVMNKVIAKKLRADAIKLRRLADKGTPLEKLRIEKDKMLAKVYSILVMNYGQPPEKFDWRYKKKADKDQKDKSKKETTVTVKDLTPKRFYDEFIGIDLNDYVDLFHAAHKKPGKQYSVQLTKNMHDGDDMTFVNVSIDDLKSIAIKSIADGNVTWFSADVGVDQNRDKGIMAGSLYDYESLFGLKIKMSRKEKALYRQTAPTHAMTLLGVDIQDDKPVKWLVENTWGDKLANKGMWTMYDDWFDANVFSVIAKKKYVPEKILKILEQDPVILPGWDPMW